LAGTAETHKVGESHSFVNLKSGFYCIHERMVAYLLVLLHASPLKTTPAEPSLDGQLVVEY
jgi:hypothetical protein